MIIVNLDVVLARRKMTLAELSERVGITQANMSILKTGKAKAIRFATLDRLCEILGCSVADILEYRSDGSDEAGENKPCPDGENVL